MENLILPSVLSDDLASTIAKMKLVEDSEAMIHLDIMDGIFVEKKTPRLDELLGKVKNDLDVHLMVVNPERILSNITDSKIKRISFHLEAVTDPIKTLNLVPMGYERGVAINPGTDIGLLEEVHDKIDFVLLMSVIPGKGGQKFMPETLGKISVIRKKYPKMLIEVDGGINAENLGLVRDFGADDFVIGSALFSKDDFNKAIASFKGMLLQ